MEKSCNWLLRRQALDIKLLCTLTSFLTIDILRATAVKMCFRWRKITIFAICFILEVKFQNLHLHRFSF